MNLKRELKRYKVLASLLHRQPNGRMLSRAFHSIHYLDISCSQGNYEYYGIGFQPKQQYVDIWPINFHNGHPIKFQLENIGKSLFVLQPTPPIHSVVYPISEASSKTPIILFISFKGNMWWLINVMNDGKWILWCSNNENDMQLKI